MRISQLTPAQRDHLVTQLDRKTSCGLLTAGQVSGGAWGDMEIEAIFKQVGQSTRSAKALARTVETFVLDPKEARIAAITQDVYGRFVIQAHGLDLEGSEEVARRLQKAFRSFLRMTSR